MEKYRCFLPLLLFTVLSLIVLLWPENPATAPRSHEIVVRASQYEFSPSRIEVQEGDTVRIDFQSMDVVHGFYLDAYGIEAEALPSVPQQLEFVADETGKFRYRCSTSCGVLHPFMIGELVVLPNRPFWKAMLISIFALCIFIFSLWQTTSSTESLEERL